MISRVRWSAAAGLVALLTAGAAAGCGGAPATSRPASDPFAAQEPARARIVLFGDGITVGVGLLEAQTYPALIQAQLEEAGYDFEIVNASVPGDTTTTALARFDQALEGDVRILVLAVGAEDGRRGVPVDQVRRHLTDMIARARERRIGVLLAGAEAPPDFGPDYAASFRLVFQDLAQAHDLVFVPVLLEGVTGRPELLQGDGMTPNTEGMRVVAERVWRALQPMVDNLGGTIS